MDVNSATATSVSALVNSPQPQPAAPKSDKQPQEQQDSTVVKLSERAQQLNRAEDQNNDTERAETKSKEAAEPSGIRFMEGESKGGRINTFA